MCGVSKHTKSPRGKPSRRAYTGLAAEPCAIPPIRRQKRPYGRERVGACWGIVRGRGRCVPKTQHARHEKQGKGPAGAGPGDAFSAPGPRQRPVNLYLGHITYRGEKLVPAGLSCGHGLFFYSFCLPGPGSPPGLSNQIARYRPEHKERSPDALVMQSRPLPPIKSRLKDV